MIFTLLTLFLIAPPEADAREARIRSLTAGIANSGRLLVESDPRLRLADPRGMIPPGSPPLLRFRYFAGADRHRFGKLDLMLDDAGH